ncbi:hypothetical protein [Halobacillus sp. H74]|uniref:hypothetical protein n=1 Tax=Halobacillus sp. H74 TaxID=3457436 RepID=UPI003FCE5A06
MRKLLATLICGNITSICFAIYFTKESDMFLFNLYGISCLVFLGLFLLAFPFSFLIEKVGGKLDVGRFFIKLGLYILLGTIAMILLIPVLFHCSSMAIVVAVVFPIILILVEKIPEKYVNASVKISLIFSLGSFIVLYYTIR